MKHVVCESVLNVQTSKQCGKKMAVDRGPPGDGGGSPMVQPVQWLIRHLTPMWYVWRVEKLRTGSA